MRLGLFIPQGWRFDLVGIPPAEQWAVMNGLAQRADAGSTFESVWVYDHFHTTPEPSREATHEAWTLMAAFAASTSRVRLGQMCTCMGYRNPAYLAKVAATVDIVSGGRVEMGIGAGWYEHEWRAYGYGFPDVGPRITALAEGVQIMKQAWETGEATFSGKVFTVDGAIVEPRPLQRGGIPLWIAGGGEKRTLRFVARWGQYANIAGDPEGFAHKSAILAQHCKDVGRDFGEITRSANYNVIIGETAAEVADKLNWVESHYAKVIPHRAAEIRAQLASGPAVGTPEQIAEKLTELHGLGLGYAISYFVDAAYDSRSLDLYEQQVAPHLPA